MTPGYLCIAGAALASLALPAMSTSAWAQGVRIRATTVIQGVELRPLVEDSVPLSQTSGSGPYRVTATGILVRCVGEESWCRFRRSGPVGSAFPLAQDIQAALWGAGEGVSLHTHLRARASLGSASLSWPRAGDRFDAIEAFLQLQRPQARLRLGRIWLWSGLGSFNIDGATLWLRRGSLQLEGFAGASLVAGLNEEYTGTTLGKLDDLPPDERGYTGGLRASARWRTARVGTAYQRVIRADRSGLYSERVAFDASLIWLGTSFSGSLAYDLIAGQANEASLIARRQLSPALDAFAQVRRRRPFFETWTIWGAFSPVGFDEWRAAASWNEVRGRYALEVHGGQRRYSPTEAGLEYLPLRNDAWLLGAAARLASPAWALKVDYDLAIGFGASRSDAMASLVWNPGERWQLGLTGSALQNVYEFRLGTSRVLGAAIEWGFALSNETWLRLDAALYKHRLPQEAAGSDWSQRRAALRLEWTLGHDPGARGARGN
jgi:hypothetical protein